MAASFFVVGAFILLVLLIPVIDIFRQKWRRRKIQVIAHALDWEFTPIGRSPARSSLSKYVEQNVVEGIIEGIPARVFDVPVQTELKTEFASLAGWRGTVHSYPPDTILIMEFEQEVIPKFVLRPRTWADGFVKPEILGKNFVVEGNDKEILLELFDKVAIGHYEQQEGLHIRVAGKKVNVQYNPDNYLPATKERYMDLIAEGKYIVKLIKKFPNENKAQPLPRQSQNDKLKIT